MEINNYALLGLIEKLLAIGLLVFWIIPQQFAEVTRPKNVISSYRLRLLLMEGLIVLLLLPATIRSIGLLHEDSPTFLAAISSVTTNMGLLLFVIMLGSFYRFRD